MKKWLYLGVVLILLFLIIFFVKQTKKEGVNNEVNNEVNKEINDKIRVGYNTESIMNASIIVAHEKGFFEKNGISANLVPLKGGKEVRQAIVADQVDIGLGAFTNFMTAMEVGAPIKFIAASASSANMILVRPNENINKFEDLYGKKICSGIAGTSDIGFRIAMEKEGVDVNKMEFIDIEREFQVAALMTKKAVSAVVVSEQDVNMLTQAGAIILPEWESKGYSQSKMPRNQLAVNTDFLNSNQKTVEKFLDAYADAQKFIVANPEESARLISEHIKEGSGGAVNHLPEKIVEDWKNKKIVNMIWDDPMITIELAKKAKEMGLVEKELLLNDVFDLRFENKLKSLQAEIYGYEN